MQLARTALVKDRTRLLSRIKPQNLALTKRHSKARIAQIERHSITDTLGLMLFAHVHEADIQDRDGAPEVVKAIRYRFPWLRHLFADGGYAGHKLRKPLRGCGQWNVEIIKRSDTAKGFEGLFLFAGLAMSRRTCGKARRVA